MKCRVCFKGFHPSRIKIKSVTDLARELQVCANCQRKIRGGKIRSKGEKRITECVVCGAVTDHYNSTPTCQLGGCRGIWYRMNNEKKVVRNAMIDGDYTKLGSMNIKRLFKLGFQIKVSEA